LAHSLPFQQCLQSTANAPADCRGSLKPCDPVSSCGVIYRLQVKRRSSKWVQHPSTKRPSWCIGAQAPLRSAEPFL
jgi:hypothetical protein